MARTKAGTTKKTKAASTKPIWTAVEVRTLAPKLPIKYEGLTKEEAAYLNALRKLNRAPMLDNAVRVAATFWTQGNFTIVRLLTWTNDKRLKPEELVGVAKCNPRDDEYDWTRAVKIALARAARGEAQVEAA